MTANHSQHSSQKPAPPSAGLFDKIICAITLEKELKQTKKILLFFVALLGVSVILLPFSWLFFIYQWKISGAYYFIWTAITNLDIFFSLWQDFTLSILESLPIIAITFFAINIALFLFTIRLFLYKKGMLLKYVKHHFVGMHS